MGYTVNITVFDSDGETPVAEAKVLLITNSATVSQVTDELGLATFADVNAGVYEVAAIKRGLSFNNFVLSVNDNVSQPVSAKENPLTPEDRAYAESLVNDAQLPTEMFGNVYYSNEDMIQWIGTEVLPEARGFLDSSVQGAISPLTFPFKDSFMIALFRDDTTISAKWKEWSTARSNTLRAFCLYKIFLGVDNTKEDYIAKAEAYRREAMLFLEAYLKSLKNASTQMSPNKGNSFGLLLIKTKKNRRVENDFALRSF